MYTVLTGGFRGCVIYNDEWFVCTVLTGGFRGCVIYNDEWFVCTVLTGGFRGCVIYNDEWFVYTVLTGGFRGCVIYNDEWFVYTVLTGGVLFTMMRHVCVESWTRNQGEFILIDYTVPTELSRSNMLKSLGRVLYY